MKNQVLNWTILNILLLGCIPALGRSINPSLLVSEIYVSPNGHDSQSGTKENPLASLTEARNRLRKRINKNKQAFVYLREGSYYLKDSFQLDQQDSGTSQAPITYKAYQDETVIITGAASLDPTAFQSVTDPTILSRLSSEARPYVQVCDLADQGITDYGQLSQFTEGQIAEAELFIDHRPQTLAQWPNEDFARIGKVYDAGSNDPPRGAIFGCDDTRSETWTNHEDIWIVGFWRVEMLDSVKLKRVDSQAKRIYTETAPKTWGGTGITQNHRMYFINVLDELDIPTEYYINRDTGKLYVYPNRPFTANTIIQLSQLDDKLIDLNNVSHVTFQNLILEGTRDNAIGTSHSSFNTFVGCTFRNLGRQAITMWLGEHNLITDCTFQELGTGGVRIFGGDRQTLERGDNHIHNNHFYNYGRRDRTTCWPIRIERVGHTVSHNLVHGSWRGGCSFPGNDHRFEYNEICNILKHSNDSSAIGSGFDWTGSGTDIRYNFIHHYHGIPSHSIIAVGVYVDDGLSGNQVYQNVFYDLDMGFFSHGGRATHVNNNLIIDCDRSMNYMDASLVTWWDSRFATLIRKLDNVPSDQPLYTEKYPHLLGIFEDLDKHAANPNNIEYQYPKENKAVKNLIYNSGDPEIPTNAANYGTFDNNYKMAAGEDAGFIDPNTYNFGLRPDSPIYDLIPGFEEIPFDKIGLTITDDRPAPPHLGTFDLLLPRNNTNLQQNSEITFVWESCSFADAYELEIATDTAFNNIIKRISQEDMCRAYGTITIPNFSFTRIYWRVKAYTNARSMLLDQTYSDTPYYTLKKGRISNR